jgi:ribosomal protein S18 acetylase RimI-like enzyme
MVFDVIGDDLLLRPKAANDQDFCCNLYTATRAWEFAGTGLPQAAIAQLLAGQFDAQTQFFDSQHPNAQHGIIQQGGVDIGLFYLDDSGPHMHLLELSIVPDRQGRGIGTQVLSAARDTAHGAGRSMSLSVAKHNPAQNLYARLGFDVTGDTGTHWTMKCPVPD